MHFSPLRVALCLSICSALHLTSSAQTSPQPFIGHELGEAFTRHHLVVDYVEHMAEAVPHWELTTYGETSEGRPLLGLIMSSPENMVRLDELKAENA